MIRPYQGTANSVYPELINDLLHMGADVPSRNGITKEIHPCMIELTDTQDRLVTSYGRPINVAFALAEVLWILSGRRDVPMLEHYNKRISAWSDDGAVFNAPYGYRLREAHGHDQLADVIRTLQKDPGSRQAVLAVWLPSQDRGWDVKPDDGTWTDWHYEPHVTEDRACNMLCHLMIRDGGLDWLQIVRSNDAVWGLPYNLMQWTHLHEYVAEHVGVPLGKMFWLSDSMHIYGSTTPGVAGDGTDDTVAWDDARGIREFNLYRHTGCHHRPMGKLTSEHLTEIVYLEMSLRTENMGGSDARDIISNARIPYYWADVLEILYAHTLYVAGRDDEAFDYLLTCQDRVYALAQIRFYWSMRWRRGSMANEIKTNVEAKFNEKLAGWICAD